MTAVGSRKSWGPLDAILIVVVIGALAVGFQPWRLMADSSKESAASTTAEAPVAGTLPVSPPDLCAQPEDVGFVDFFNPTSLVIEGLSGNVVDTAFGPVTRNTTGVLTPQHDYLPSMLVGDDTRVTAPGSNQGTVLAISHSRLGDDRHQGNRLMEDIPGQVRPGDYRIVLAAGPSGPQMAYCLEKVLDIPKAKFGSEGYKYLQDNRKGRVLIMSSWITGTYEGSAMARILVGCDAAHRGCSNP